MANGSLFCHGHGLGGGFSTCDRCLDDDAMAVYCSSGPHVLSQMWPGNAKNEACFPPFTFCVTVSAQGSMAPMEQYGMDPNLRPRYKACEG